MKPGFKRQATMIAMVSFCVFGACMHSTALAKKKDSSGKQETSMGERKKEVAGDAQKSFPSPQSGAADLATQIVNAIKAKSYGNNRFVIAGTRSGLEENSNKFEESVINFVYVELLKEGTIHLVADPSLMQKQLQEIARQQTEFYDEKAIAQAGKNIGATAILVIKSELMKADANIVVIVLGLDAEKAELLQGLAAQTNFHFDGDNKEKWLENAPKTTQGTGQLQYEMALYGMRAGEKVLFAVEPNTQLKAGDGIKVRIKTTEDCYVYVANRDAAGICSPIFPHEDIKTVQNPIRANQEIYLPEAKDEFFVLDDSGSGGNEEIWYAISRKPLPDLDDFIKKIASGSVRGNSDQNWVKTRGLSKIAKVQTKSFIDPGRQQQVMTSYFSTPDAEVRSVLSFMHVK